jgi:hypothetical protein
VTSAVKQAKSGTPWRRVSALLFFAGLMLAALAFASSGRAAIETPPPPSVWSDKADYAPGETVTLSGANWAPGESVHIRVNDDAGQTWSRDVDVTAAEDGTISDQFDLPGWFVAVYNVTATGASSGTATWTFTDGNVTLHLEAAQGVANMTVTYDRWNGTNQNPNSTCSGSPTLTNLTVTVPASSGTVNITGFGGQNDSVRLKSVTTTTSGKTFDRWTSAVPRNPDAMHLERHWRYERKPAGRLRSLQEFERSSRSEWPVCLHCRRHGQDDHAVRLRRRRQQPYLCHRDRAEPRIARIDRHRYLHGHGTEELLRRRHLHASAECQRLRQLHLQGERRHR